MRGNSSQPFQISVTITALWEYNQCALSPVTRRGASSNLHPAERRMVLRAVPLLWNVSLGHAARGAQRDFYTESSYQQRRQRLAVSPP